MCIPSTRLASPTTAIAESDNSLFPASSVGTSMVVHDSDLTVMSMILLVSASCVGDQDVFRFSSLDSGYTIKLVIVINENWRVHS